MCQPYWCSECRQPTNLVHIDFGIGPGEYWGRPFIHKDVQPCSECCEAELLLEDPAEADYEKMLEQLEDQTYETLIDQQRKAMELK